MSNHDTTDIARRGEMKARTKSSKPETSRVRREKIELSSGNVFADLEFEDAEQLLLKAELTSRIAQL